MHFPFSFSLEVVPCAVLRRNPFVSGVSQPDSAPCTPFYRRKTFYQPFLLALIACIRSVSTVLAFALVRFFAQFSRFFSSSSPPGGRARNLARRVGDVRRETCTKSHALVAHARSPSLGSLPSPCFIFTPYSLSRFPNQTARGWIAYMFSGSRFHGASFYLAAG